MSVLVGHEITGCFRLIGYPEWWGDRSKSSDAKGASGQSRKGFGHGQGSSAKAHVVTTPSSASTEIENEIREIPGLAENQVQQVLNLFQNQPGKDDMAEDALEDGPLENHTMALPLQLPSMVSAAEDVHVPHDDVNNSNDPVVSATDANPACDEGRGCRIKIPSTRLRDFNIILDLLNHVSCSPVSPKPDGTQPPV
ncbi:hypothetical protein V2J09_024199 [Rumex salicifolius]